MTSAKTPKGLQRKTPMKRGTTPLRRGAPLKSDPKKGLKSDPAKSLKRTSFRSSPEKIREQWDKEKERALEKARERRNAPLERKSTASLERKPLERSKSLTASGKPTRKPLSQKPSTRKRPQRPAVTAEERACREVVAGRSEGICEKCGGAGGLEKAHRIARSQGGRWDASNVLDLCHLCHHGNHGQPQVAYDHGWHLRGHSEETTKRPVLLRKGWSVGWALLDDTGGYEWVDGPEWDEDLMSPHA